jgi:hypothetical protein
VIRPPRTVPAAVWRLIIGLTLMFVLAPATRFGYFIYPLCLLVWLGASQLGTGRSAVRAERADGDPRKELAAAPSPLRARAVPGPRARRASRLALRTKRYGNSLSIYRGPRPTCGCGSPLCGLPEPSGISPCGGIGISTRADAGSAGARRD